MNINNTPTFGWLSLPLMYTYSRAAKVLPLTVKPQWIVSAYQHIRGHFHGSCAQSWYLRILFTVDDNCTVMGPDFAPGITGEWPLLMYIKNIRMNKSTLSHLYLPTVIFVLHRVIPFSIGKFQAHPCQHSCWRYLGRIAGDGAGTADAWWLLCACLSCKI